jgi:hypothetical protein
LLDASKARLDGVGEDHVVREVLWSREVNKQLLATTERSQFTNGRRFYRRSRCLRLVLQHGFKLQCELRVTQPLLLLHDLARDPRQGRLALLHGAEESFEKRGVHDDDEPNTLGRNVADVCCPSFGREGLDFAKVHPACPAEACEA